MSTTRGGRLIPARKVQDLDEIRRWYQEGRTTKWMVGEYRRKYNLEVVLSMFSNLRQRHGWDRRIARDDDLIPWAVAEEHRYHYDVRMLRLLARRRGGFDLSADAETRLDGWLTKLERRQMVVTYDPSLGFMQVPRTAEDADVIRRPEIKTTRRRNAD